MSSGALLSSVFAVAIAIARPAHGATAVLELQPYLGRLVTLDATIDGRSARLLVDTAAGITAITPEFARHTGCNPHGAIVAYRMSGEQVTTSKCLPMRFQLQGYGRRLRPMVLDLMALLPQGAPPIDGVIGLDAFDGALMKFDFGRGVIEVGGRPPARKAGVVRLAREAGGLGLSAFITVEARVGDVNLLLDSANLAGTLLSPAAARQLAGSTDAGTLRLTLRPHGLSALPVTASVKPLIYDGAIGAEFFLTHAVWLDLENGRIWYADPARGGRRARH
jgi:predicted aspartyl protease